MRRSILALPLLLLVGCASSAPLTPVAPQAEAVPRANKMVVRTTDTPDEAYRRLGQLLIQRGYTLQNSDAALRSLSTDFRDVGGSRMSINAFVSEVGGQTQVEMKGRLQLSVNVGQALGGAAMREDASQMVEQRGMSGSPFDRTFRELEATARAYPSGTVLYARD